MSERNQSVYFPATLNWTDETKSFVYRLCLIEAISFIEFDHKKPKNKIYINSKIKENSSLFNFCF